MAITFIINLSKTWLVVFTITNRLWICSWILSNENHFHSQIILYRWFCFQFVIYSTYPICCLLDFPLNRWDTLQISRNLSPQPWCNTTLMRSHFLSGIKITLRHFAQSVNVWTSENTHELLVITSQVSLYPCICYITLIEISKRRVREIWS